MMSKTSSLLLVIVFCWSVVWQDSSAVVHGPKLSRKVTREPFVIEINDLQEPLNDIYNKAKEKSRSKRNLPSVAPHGFGTTVKLSNDHHTFGLVHWSGVPHQRIFILTRDRDSNGKSQESYLWLSKDYGKTFDNVTYHFPPSAVLEWFYISSDADKLIFTDIIHHKIYVTLDEGDNFTEYSVQFRPDTLRFQYSRIPNVKDSYVLGYDTGDKSLWVSTNSGASWTKLGDNITRYEWRQLNATYEDPSTVYFDKLINSTAALLYKATLSNTYQSQLFDSSLGPFMPNSFMLSYQYMFIQKNYTDVGYNGKDYMSPLWVSNYRGLFQSAYFYLKIEEKHYAMVDASEGQVLMAVYHDPNNTNLYLSEEAGLNYSLSLQHIISPPEYDWIDSYPTFDVYVVEGIPGIYIVNKVAVYGSDQGSTVISFDKGGEWRSLTPPTVNANGVLITCNPPCSLHLHMYVDKSRGFQPILSQDSAPNIIMALGNLGTKLNRYNYGGLKLYISDNGGWTWRELSSGYKQFQLIDFGVFISVVNKWTQTHTVLSSCDEGHTWVSYDFNSGHYIYVVAMYTEYGEESQHVTIFGYYPGVSYSTFEWLVIDLDFTTLNLSQCNASDYYQWDPTDERDGPQCILGETVVYERRYPDHCCYIDYNYSRPISRKSCYCSYEDFECDVGFQRVGLDGMCTPMAGVQYPPPPPPGCYEGGTYSYTSKYRKVAGDKCINGNQTFYLPVSVECPVEGPADMSIAATTITARVGENVTFTLSQHSGSKKVTFYYWNFGDQLIPGIQGFAQAKLYSHTYNTPNDYNVVVIAKNTGGNNTAQLLVHVIDEITGVDVTYSNRALLGSPVNFYVNVTSTKYNTNYYEPVRYTWVFGNISHFTTIPAVTHTFNSNGTHSFYVIISNMAGSKLFNGQVLVEDRPTDLLLTASVGGALLSTGHVPVGSPVIFNVSSTSYALPQNTSYHWLIQFSNTTVMLSLVTKSPLSITFPILDTYIVRVSLQTYFGYSQVAHVYISEYYISNVVITDLIQTVYRVNSDITVNMTIQLSGSPTVLYNGKIIVQAWVNQTNGQQSSLGSRLLLAQSSIVSFTFKSSLHGPLHVYFEASNNVSTAVTTKIINVAGSKQYAYLRLLFDLSSVPSNYHTIQWQTLLQNVIIDSLLKQYKLQDWQLQVNVTVETQTIAFKRQTSSEQLVAHVYILPVDLSTYNITTVFNIAGHLYNDSNDGNVNFIVNNTTIVVSSADYGPKIIEIIITPSPRPKKDNKKDYKPLAIGLGVGTFLLILLAFIIIVLVSVYWRKRYRSLEVRYTRLRQGPMRFTFTAEGETVEEEEWQDDENEEEESKQDKDGSITKMNDFPPFK